MVSVSFV